jgi:hypothetical protein
MLSSTTLKFVALTGLVLLTSASYAASGDLITGKQLSAQELKNYLNAPTVTIDSHSFKVISTAPQARAGGAVTPAITKVINEQGVVGESHNDVVTSLASVDSVKQAAARLSPAPVSAQYYAHLNISAMHFASFQDAVNARAQLKKALPQARVDIPIRYAKPTAR